jgi:ribosomal protein S20
MKAVIFLLCSISLLGIDISELREKYPEAHTDKALTNNLNEKLATISIANEPKMVAYKGAVLTLMAKHAKAIKEKKMYFKEGVQFLESAVDKAPNDLEIRYLRLSVQEHAPKLVKYSSNIEEDKRFIQEKFKTQGNTVLKTYIKSYVKASSLFTDEEKQAF